MNQEEIKANNKKRLMLVVRLHECNTNYGTLNQVCYMKCARFYEILKIRREICPGEELFLTCNLDIFEIYQEEYWQHAPNQLHNGYDQMMRMDVPIKSVQTYYRRQCMLYTYLLNHPMFKFSSNDQRRKYQEVKIMNRQQWERIEKTTEAIVNNQREWEESRYDESEDEW